MTPKPWENGEGYPDPTAYNALRPIMQEDAALEGKVNFLIKVLKFIIAESGFELLARIEIKDKKTGRCFRWKLLTPKAPEGCSRSLRPSACPPCWSNALRSWPN